MCPKYAQAKVCPFQLFPSIIESCPLRYYDNEKFKCWTWPNEEERPKQGNRRIEKVNEIFSINAQKAFKN